MCALTETMVQRVFLAAYLEVFVQDVREVGSLDKPAIRNDLSLQPLDHATSQLIAVSSITNNCRGGKILMGQQN